MIDPTTYGRFNAASIKARHHGWALVEVLDRDRLLLTEQRQTQIKLDVLEDLYRTIEQAGVSAFLSPESAHRGGTPHEAYRGLLEFIKSYAKVIENG